MGRELDVQMRCCLKWPCGGGSGPIQLVWLMRFVIVVGLDEKQGVWSLGRTILADSLGATMFTAFWPWNVSHGYGDADCVRFQKCIYLEF